VWIWPLQSASGGTSDGRFIANSHTQVVEMGLTNATIHQVGCRSISDTKIKDLNQKIELY
jgi:succinyl-diaminopimelate desuccinylase